MTKRSSGMSVRVRICSTYRCNQLTANLGGKCNRCLEFTIQHTKRFGAPPAQPPKGREKIS